ncbi:hypothetical protein CMV_003399 [Castanea mollissima]|uniref:Uncharacterized protein n=1 Tax=Castanea mollissima TaxID=60419 RepID=A0A8J4RH68_9ROSI|nr:hypothetical protein CMV_003399 [Castanea mollissima]
MLESALSCMLEGHHVSDKDSDTFRTSYPEIHEKFWKQLQMLLKKILAMTISTSANKSAPVSQPNTVSNRSGDAEKLRELYKMSLKFTDMSQLHAMHLKLTSKSLPVEFEATVGFAEDESLEFVSSMSESDVHEKVSSSASGDQPYEDGQNSQDLAPKGSVKMTSEENLSASQELIAAGDEELRDPGGAASGSSGNETAETASVETAADSISSIVAEVHDVCQVIKSYISGRQLHSTKLESQEGSGTTDKLPSSTISSVCACGCADCIEARNIREWLQTSKWDKVLQKLVLTLGVTCLGLGHAYKESGELLQALKVIESACYICGSMPQHLEDTESISPMISESNEETIPYSVGAKKDDKSSSADDSLTFGKSYSPEIFWSTAWMLVGDVYTKFKNCSSCPLEDCICLIDRASSGSSASSSGPRNAKTCSEACERKQRMILHAKGSPYSLLGDPEDGSVHHQMHGIYKYLRGPFVKNEVYNYSDALSCYGEARKALVGLPSDSEKLQVLVEKEEWVRDALEEIRLSREALYQSINSLLQPII